MTQRWPRAGRLLLCRHGQTEYNASLRFQGQVDAPLNALGRLQARLLGERLAQEAIDVAYSSDLARARVTAELALGERPVQIQLDARLREASFGHWEELTFAEIKERFPDEVAARDHDRVHYAMPGGESLVQLAGRVGGFLRDVLPGHEGKSILMVSHGGTVNGIISTVLPIPLSSWWRLRNNNANLTIIDFTPEGARFEVFNETCHLRSEK